MGRLKRGWPIKGDGADFGFSPLPGLHVESVQQFAPSHLRSPIASDLIEMAISHYYSWSQEATLEDMTVPPIESSAKAHFEFIKRQPIPYDYLESITDRNAPHFPFFEEEWLDFKGNPKDEKDAKKIWV